VGGLSFLAPLYLVAGLAIAIPIALHLFRRRTDLVVDFPAVRLLVRSPVEQQRRKRLRELILLALRITALALLAAAFARPYFTGRILAADAAITVIAVDRSFSMSAPGVFDRAKALAEEAIGESPAGHAMALVAFDETADIVVPATTDRGAIAAAIRTLSAGTAGTQYAAALARIGEVLGARAGDVVMVTDLQQAGWQGPPRGALPEDVPVRVKRVEAPVQNLAVIAAARRGPRIEATVQNFGLEARTTMATLAIDGTERARAPITVPPQGVVPVTFDAEVPAAGAAAVSVVDESGVRADDVRYLVLDPASATRILVLVSDPTSSGGGLYVERALEVAEQGRAFTVTVVDGRSLSSWTPEQLAHEHAVMLLGTRTLDRRGRELIAGYLKNGGSALLAAGPDVDVPALGDLLGIASPVGPAAQSLGDGGATLVLEDTRHPILRPFATPGAALGDVAFQQFRPVQEDGRRVLARFSGGPAALVEQPRASGRLLLFASDLDNKWNRFPLSPAFVPFVVETARYMTEAHRQPQAWVLPSVPPGIEATPGVHTATAGAGTGEGRRVAVNVNVEESNPAPISQEEFLAAIPRTMRTTQPDVATEARKAEDDQRLWQWGLLVMFIALAGEGLVGRRAT
jgi:hypothetical protein